MAGSIFKFSKEHYLFILSQSEKKLDATVETMNIIQKRGRFQFNIALVLMTGVISYLVATPNLELLPYSITLIITSFISMILAAFGIFKYRISTSGTDPIDLLDNQIYERFKSTKKIELNTIWSECMNYQVRIDKNYKINRKRLFLVTLSATTLYVTPIIFLFIFWCNWK